MTISCVLFFFFNDTATTEIYTLSLHDALPISFEEAVVNLGIRRQNDDLVARRGQVAFDDEVPMRRVQASERGVDDDRSEEHTSELQSRQYLVCRLLLEKKKHKN